MINDAGECAGTDQTGEHPSMPVRWSASGAVVVMETLPGGLSIVSGINAGGVTVGSCFTEEGTPGAVRWDRGGEVTALGLPDSHVVSLACDINDAGVIVGNAGPADLMGKAVRWNADGTITELPMPEDAENAVAMAINNAGVIVGEATSGRLLAESGSDPGQAVRWNTDGTVTRLPTLGGDHAAAQDINDSGVVVGSARRADGSVRAVRWSAEGEVVDLGVLAGDVKSRAEAVNNAGVVVGESINANDETHAVLWQPDGTMVALGQLPPRRPDPS
ncbi:hypothetical protein [Streptomyces smaragdinus]|uniref:hypothetical protein n=1 Tax=Streptomyces smaragdinus TaxID=2585196 RepID=UPI0018868B0A|nr:hypothetical protein [Streptomyces smaragdinus]